jgi:actin-like protein 6A
VSLPLFKLNIIFLKSVILSPYTICRKCLTIAPNEHPMLLAEPPFNTAAAREKMVEVMFEKQAPPALFIAKTSVLTSFACGRATSLVIDCGASGTTVSAVHDGYVLQKTINRSSVRLHQDEMHSIIY